MKSPITNKEMKLITEKRSFKFRKIDFEVDFQTFICEDSQEKFTSKELDEVNFAQIYNQYREKFHIPFTEEIITLRKKYGLSAKKMSELLGFGENQYSLYENGEIPSVSNGTTIKMVNQTSVFHQLLIEKKEIFSEKEYKKLIKKTEDISEFERENIQKEAVNNYIIGEKKATKYTGYTIPNWEKTTNVIVFFSEKLNPLKTTLNKLMFYTDFLHYKKTGKSITGISYRAIQYGNVPEKFDMIFKKTETENKISIEYMDFNNGNSGEKFSAKANFNPDVFNNDEIESMQSVLDFFKNKKPQDVVKICHEETSWIENHLSKNIIDYSYSFGLKAM
ncbi:type II toxin-antitoxin system antitoxin SocA domain-containing protein [Halpernia sp.]|uniref:type II toxin-antitoxin system antitoxin SocA domain-containing protein n=1 Tax=Halpernia sp. TaxID=2782209 RepID=UPI003A91E65D